MTHPLVKANDIDALTEVPRQHQFNPRAIRQTRSLGDIVGLKHMGLHLVRLEPGYESTQFHFHHQDEEFLYILSGRGIADIGDDEFEVGPGDFMGFTAGGLPHALRNPHQEDLTYLMGGTRNTIDVCDYPRIRRRMYRIDGTRTYVDTEDLHELPD
ncbi:MAG: cupin domain-containing protein [Proteobacteria bacterium]|jgi:uncharacterized cupin superfamily protein|nr:cupin domain-containing protein [Pseudomonadota bacterium]